MRLRLVIAAALVAGLYIPTGLAAELSVYDHEADQLDASSAMAAYGAGKFRSIPPDKSLGYIDHEVWFHQTINGLVVSESCCVEVRYPHAVIVGYLVKDGSIIGQQVQASNALGVPWRKAVLDFGNQLASADALLLKVQTATAVVPSFALHTRQSLLREIAIDTWVIASFYGAMLMVACFAFGGAILLRERLALLFGIYILTYILLQAAMNNIAGTIDLTLPNATLRLVPSLATISMIAFGFMVKSLLNREDRISITYVNCLVLMSCGLLVVQIFLTQKIAVTVAYIHSIFCFISLGTALQFSSASKVIKLLYWGSWCPYLGGIVLSFAKTFGLLGSNLLTNYAMQFGSAVQVLSVGVIAGLRLRQSAVERAVAIEELHARDQEINLYKAVAQTTQMLAHDVRQPFRLIRMFNAIIEKCSPEEIVSKTRWLMARLDRAERSVEALIGDVVAVGSEGRLTLISVNIQQLIVESVEDICQNFADSKIQFVYEDKLGAHASLRCDPVKLSRVFKNILSNAVEAMEGQGTITVITSGSAEHIEIVFRNDGPGMSDAEAVAIFDPFVTKRKRNGNGLGLAIAQRFVQAHGGTITCRSGAERGVDFIVALHC